MSNNVLLSMPDLLPDGAPASPEEVTPKVNLIDNDGEPMESDWHRRSMNLLLDSVDYHFRDRQDFFAGGNMFIYFSAEQERKKDFRGPDFFFVWKTTRQPQRRFWYVWDEGRTPNVVIELTSPTTRDEDHGTKKDIYEQILHVADYFCFDPDGDRLEGWQLHGREYSTISPDHRGWLWSEQLQLWLGPWHGYVGAYLATYPRFYDAQGKLILTAAEAEKKRADEQQQRADKTETELARLRERLAALEKTINDGSSNGKQ